MPRSKKLLVVTGLTLAIAAAGGLLVATCWPEKVTQREVQELMESNLPRGSSQAEIRAFLDSEDIAYGVAGNASDWSVLREYDVSADTQVLGAIVRDTSGSSLFVTEDIDIFFILDDAGRLNRIITRPVYTGP